MREMGDQISIAYCLLPIAYETPSEAEVLPIAYCLLPIAHCLLPIAHCPLPVPCSLFPHK